MIFIFAEALSHSLKFGILEKRIVKLFNLERKGATFLYFKRTFELNMLTVVGSGTELPLIIFLT